MGTLPETMPKPLLKPGYILTVAGACPPSQLPAKETRHSGVASFLQTCWLFITFMFARHLQMVLQVPLFRGFCITVVSVCVSMLKLRSPTPVHWVERHLQEVCFFVIIFSVWLGSLTWAFNVFELYTILCALVSCFVSSLSYCKIYLWFQCNFMF